MARKRHRGFESHALRESAFRRGVLLLGASSLGLFAGLKGVNGRVLGFKGLERSAVVLAVNGIRDVERAREYSYVGMSQARTQLVVCGDLDEIAKWGGGGLRRRLARSAV